MSTRSDHRAGKRATTIVRAEPITRRAELLVALTLVQLVGRHLRTIHGLTGVPLLTFEYDAEGLLEAVVHGVDETASNRTLIVRDMDGVATAIRSRFGQETLLGIGPSGYLEHLTTPSGEVAHMEYSTEPEPQGCR